MTPKRNDGNPETLCFIGSPETVVAYALAGRLDFNPMTDEIEAEDGEIEVEYMLDGQEYEVTIAPDTGMVLEVEIEDDD